MVSETIRVILNDGTKSTFPNAVADEERSEHRLRILVDGEVKAVFDTDDVKHWFPLMSPTGN